MIHNTKIFIKEEHPNDQILKKEKIYEKKSKIDHFFYKYDAQNFLLDG